jgi:hypothetical protein
MPGLMICIIRLHSDESSMSVMGMTDGNDGWRWAHRIASQRIASHRLAAMGGKSYGVAEKDCM